MGRRVEVLRDWAERVPDSWEGWAGLTGTVVARSRTTSITRCDCGGSVLYIKRHVYPLGVALRASLRNTLFGRSRARKEFKNLETLRSRAGEDAAPAPVAVGEARRFGLLRNAFLATEALPYSPLSQVRPGDRPIPERLGRFLARLHGAGFVHGSLFARNVLGSGRRFAVVDLDKSRFSADGRPLPLALRARDLACLCASIDSEPLQRRLRVLVAYRKQRGETEIRDLIQAVERHMDEAERRLARRVRV